MKKVALLLVGLVAAMVSSFAQMMPDSTVQVVAYWEAGERHVFQMEEVKLNIAEGDTTVVEKSAELLAFEVVSADEEKGYRVKVTSLDSQISDATKAAISEKMRERFGGDVYYFETSPYGEFLQVLPIEGLAEQTDALVEDVVEAVMQKTGTGEENRPALQALIRQMITPESMMTSVEGEISPMFMYHGSRLEMSKEYTFEDDIPNLIGGGTVRMNGRFWVNEELTDEYSVVLQMYKEADQEQVKQFVTSLLGGVVQSFAAEGEDAKASIEELYKDSKIDIEDFLFEEVHLDTGWPLEWHFTRKTLIQMQGQQQEQIIRKSVKLLFEEEE
jgi:hypothetical protein